MDNIGCEVFEKLHNYWSMEEKFNLTQYGVCEKGMIWFSTCTEHCTLNNVLWTLYIKHCTTDAVQYTVYIVHCILHTVQCIPVTSLTAGWCGVSCRTAVCSGGTPGLCMPFKCDLYEDYEVGWRKNSGNKQKIKPSKTYLALYVVYKWFKYTKLLSKVIWQRILSSLNNVTNGALQVLSAFVFMKIAKSYWST